MVSNIIGEVYILRYAKANYQMHTVMMLRRCMLVLLFLSLGAWSVHAQPWSTDLPTPQGGDYGNGAATSDAVGGVFIDGQRAAAIPAIAFGIPTGFGADWRDVFAAAGMQSGLRFDQDFIDGAVFSGAGIGDAQRTVGMEVTWAIIDLVGETFKDQTLSIKLHRRLGSWSAAVGIENMFIKGVTDGGTSAYGVVSGSLLPEEASRTWLQQITLTAGVGDGRFNSVDRVRRGVNGASLFGSVAVRMLPAASAFATWNGQDLTLGLSVVPLKQLPVVVTPVLLDVSQRADSRPRFAMSIGIGWTF